MYCDKTALPSPYSWTREQQCHLIVTCDFLMRSRNLSFVKSWSMILTILNNDFHELVSFFAIFYPRLELRETFSSSIYIERGDHATSALRPHLVDRKTDSNNCVFWFGLKSISLCYFHKLQLHQNKNSLMMMKVMMTMMKTSWWGAHMTVVDHMEWESAARASVKVMSDMFHMFNMVTMLKSITILKCLIWS